MGINTARVMADTLNGRISRQTRIISLLLTEASQHMHWLVNDLDLISGAAEGNALHLFDKLKDAERLLEEFTDESVRFYPESKVFWEGNADATDAFTDVIEAATGINWRGEKSAEYRLVAVYPEEAHELNAFLNKREKVRQHAQDLSQDKLYKGTSAMSWGGWNAIKVCCYKDGGREWRKFDSLRAAGKALGLSATKIKKAMENGEDYQGWSFVTDTKFESLKANHKIRI